MARNGGPSVDVRIHSWPGRTVDVGPSIARPTTVGPEQDSKVVLRWQPKSPSSLFNSSDLYLESKEIVN